MINLPISGNDVVGFKGLQLRYRVKQQLAECVLNTLSLDRFKMAEEILHEAELLHYESWSLVFKHFGADERLNLKYDHFNDLILKL